MSATSTDAGQLPCPFALPYDPCFSGCGPQPRIQTKVGARSWMAEISGGSILRRRLSDALAAHQFSEVQLIVLNEQAGVHHVRNIGLRLAALHRRLDTLEAELRRHAKVLGEDPTMSVSELRQRLAARADRRQLNQVNRRVERRLWVRRQADQFSMLRSLVETAGNRVPPIRSSLRQLLDVFDDLVFVASPHWDCLTGNQTAVALLGYPPHELYNTSLYSLITSDVTSNDNSSRWPRTVFLRRKDGNVARIQARAQSVFLSGGAANLLIGHQA